MTIWSELTGAITRKLPFMTIWNGLLVRVLSYPLYFNGGNPAENR